MIDRYAVRSFGTPQQLTSLSVDGSGLVHAVGTALSGPLGNSFAVTANAISKGDDIAIAFLARVDFSAAELFAPACMVNAASLATTIWM